MSDNERREAALKRLRSGEPAPAGMLAVATGEDDEGEPIDPERIAELRAQGLALRDRLEARLRRCEYIPPEVWAMRFR